MTMNVSLDTRRMKPASSATHVSRIELTDNINFVFSVSLSPAVTSS